MDRWARIQALWEAEQRAAVPAAPDPEQPARPARTGIVGVDLAAHADHPAVAVVSGRPGDWVLELADRLPQAGAGGDPQTHWQRTAAAVGAVAAELGRDHEQVLVLADGGGVGDAVAELIRGQLPQAALETGSVRFYSVVTVAGVKPYGPIAGSRGRYSVGKDVLADGVALVLEQGLIRADGMVTPELMRELLSVERKPDGRIEAAGSGHDDLVAALALAVLPVVDRHRNAGVKVHSPARYASPVRAAGAGVWRESRLLGGVYVRPYEGGAR